MKKKFISVFKKISVTALILVLLSTLSLNVFTLWSLSEIKRDGFIKSGFSCAVVGSGSMEPAISINDFLLIKSGGSYQVEDIVTYVSAQGSLITHRIKEVYDNGYIMQGDANNIPDEEIAKQKVLGKVIFIIPKAGGVINAILSPVGILLLTCIFLLVWLSKRIKENENELENEKAECIFDDISGN